MALFKRKPALQEAVPRTVLAAAIPLSGPQTVTVAKQFGQGELAWQKEAWYQFDACGELRSALGWKANACSRARIYGAETDPETGQITGPTEDPRAQAIAASVLGGVKRAGQLQSTIAFNWDVAGLAWIVIRPRSSVRGVAQPDEWLVLSVRELQAKGSQWQYTDPSTGLNITLGPTDRLIRVWAPHPAVQTAADSAVRAALPILREIEKSSQNIAARLDSRVASNGILPIPVEADFPKSEGQSNADSLMAVLHDAMSASLANPGKPSAQVPIMVDMPGELIAAWSDSHMDLSTAFDAAVVELRQDGLNRLAASLDMPNEIAKGSMGDVNHWSAWQVEETAYKIYIQALLDRLADAITQWYYQDALAAAGVPDPERHVLAWDITGIVSRPDQGADMRELHDRELISDDALRGEFGVPDDDIPSDEELSVRRAWKLAQLDPTLVTNPQIAQLLGLPEIEAPEPAAPPVPELEAVPEEPAGTVPDTQGERPEPSDGLVAAAEFGVYDALARMGKRMLTRAHRGQYASTKPERLYLEVPWDQIPVNGLEGSFAYLAPVAEAHGWSEAELAGRLRAYTRDLVTRKREHDREALKQALR